VIKWIIPCLCIHQITEMQFANIYLRIIEWKEYNVYNYTHEIHTIINLSKLQAAMQNVDAVFKYLAQDYFVIVIKRALICLMFRYSQLYTGTWSFNLIMAPNFSVRIQIVKTEPLKWKLFSSHNFTYSTIPLSYGTTLSKLIDTRCWKVIFIDVTCINILWFMENQFCVLSVINLGCWRYTNDLVQTSRWISDSSTSAIMHRDYKATS